MKTSTHAPTLFSDSRGMAWSMAVKALPPREAKPIGTSDLPTWGGLPVSVVPVVTETFGPMHQAHAKLALLLKGRSRMVIKSRTLNYDGDSDLDTVCVWPPHLELTRSFTVGPSHARVVLIDIDDASLHRLGMEASAQELAAGLQQQPWMRRNPDLVSLVRLMAHEVLQGNPHGTLYAQSLSLGLIAYLLKSTGGAGDEAPHRNVFTAAQRARILERIEDGLGEQLTLDQLSQAAGVGRFHFLRLFKNSWGTTPHRFLLKRRVEAAQHLLESSELPMAEIAMATGFCSQSHLTNAMKQHLGATPGQVRRGRVHN